MNAMSKQLTLLDQWFFVQKVVSDRRLSRCAVACAFYLIDYYNDYFGRAWPSYDTLAKLTNSNRRTVITAVKKLLELGYFTVEKGEGRRSNYYRPNFALARKDSDQPTAGDEEATSPVAQTSPLQGVMVNSTPPNTSDIPVAPSGGDKEVSPRSARSVASGAPSPSRGAPPGFDLFWQAYPRKENRKAALAAYSMALQLDGVTPELLASKAAQYAEAKAGNDPKWIKMPKTWLDDECWLEDPQPSKQKPAQDISRTKGKHSSGKPKDTSSSPARNRAKKPRSRSKRAGRSSSRGLKTNTGSRPSKRKQRDRATEQSQNPSNREPNKIGREILDNCSEVGISLAMLSSAVGLGEFGLEDVVYRKVRLSQTEAHRIRQTLSAAAEYLRVGGSVNENWLSSTYSRIRSDYTPKSDQGSN